MTEPAAAAATLDNPIIDPTAVAPAVPTCVYCTRPIIADEARSELRCHHLYHTNCLVRRFIDDREETCLVCDVFIVQEEVHYHNGIPCRGRRGDRKNITDERWEKNKEFRTQVKAYVKSLRAAHGPSRAYVKLCKEKLNEIKPQVKFLHEQLSALYDLTLQDIRKSDVYKNYRKAISAFGRHDRFMKREYNLPYYSLRDTLMGKPGLRRWPKRLSRSPQFILRRAFGFRIRYRMSWF